ncbi:MAG: radical SAM protein [Clostridia bacterium]|nr:radical SAM protein [Clostridia bacterium]
MSRCLLCPRKCGADRTTGARGACGMPAEIMVARAALHPFEEPPISGTRGSGTVFFTGCALGCIFCQNRALRAQGGTPPKGKALDERGLADLFLRLADAGAHNINLVTASHYTDRVARALSLARPTLKIPVVWNSSGYERVETLRMLDGLVDIYLPDFKYCSPEVARAYANAPDYADTTAAALAEMHRQLGAVCFDKDGLLTRGVLVRHLVLPGTRQDSIAVLHRIADTLPVREIRLSLMRQYTPDFTPDGAPAHLHRRVTSFEYDTVLKAAIALGFEGYFQAKESASAAFTPDFDDGGLLP